MTLLINTQIHTIKMKPIVVKNDSYVNFDSNGKDPKFKIGDQVRVSKHKKIFAKEYAPNWSEKDFVISEIENKGSMNLCFDYLNDFADFGEQIIERELQKTNQKEYIKNQYFPKSYRRFGEMLKLSSYEAKAELKNATGVDTSKLAEKFNLVSLKSEIDKIDVEK